MNNSTAFDRYVVNIVVIATFVAYFQVFKFVFVPYPVQMLGQFVMGMLLLFMILLKIIYFNENHAVMNFKGPVLMILLGAIPSYFVAAYYHQQGIPTSFYASRALLFFLFYFFLHYYKVPVTLVMKIIIVVGLIAVFLYYAQMSLYPKMFMNLQGSESRGTIRLFVPGMICTIAAYFYFLNRFFESNNYKLLIFALITFSVFILQGTRQLIFSTFFLTVLNLILSNRVRSKVVMVFLISLAGFAVFMIFRDIFLALNEVSTAQSKNVEGDMRVRAAKFFLTSYMPGNAAYIFGNGNADAGSPFHIKNMYYSTRYGYFLSDIGMIGDYVRYGVIFTIGSLILIIKSLTFKVSGAYNFLKYYILAQCFTLFTGKGFIGGADIVFVSILYIFDVEHAKMLLSRKKSNP